MFSICDFYISKIWRPRRFFISCLQNYSFTSVNKEAIHTRFLLTNWVEKFPVMTLKNEAPSDFKIKDKWKHKKLCMHCSHAIDNNNFLACSSHISNFGTCKFMHLLEGTKNNHYWQEMNYKSLKISITFRGVNWFE